MIADERNGWNQAWAEATVEAEIGTLSYGWVQPFLGFLTRHLSGQDTVLEAGCGLGRFLHWLAQQGHTAFGVDCSLTALAKAKRAMPRARVVAADVRRLPFRDEIYDACLSFGVIEHFPEGPDAALAEAWRVVKLDGLLLLSVPHANLLSRIAPPLKAAYRWARKIPRAHAAPPEPPGRYYTRAELTRPLARTGWRVTEIMPFGHAYTLHSFCRLFRKRGAYHDVTPLGVALGRILARVFPWAMASTVLVAARKVRHDANNLPAP